MTNILFSIIIPTYNRADLIKRTIMSAINQTYLNFEIIVVDDGSTDDTEEIVYSINNNKVKYYKKENSERGATRNFGAKKANGNYVYFLDSDDILYNNHLEIALKFIEKNQNPKVFFQQYEFLLKNGNKKSNIKINASISDSLIKIGNFMSCHGVFIERLFFLDNLFNEDRNLSGTEDFELWLRIASRTNILFNNTITSALVEHNNRSVLLFNEQNLINRTTLLIKYLNEDNTFMNIYGNKLNKIEGQMLSYISIHAALEKEKKIAIKYFLKSIRKNANQIFTKRTLAIIKRMFF